MVARARNDGGAGGAASHGRAARAPPCPPSLRGGGAAEAIQAAVPRVMGGRRPVWPCPILDCFALACARARNDGGAGSAASHGREVRAPPCPPSLRGGGAAEAIQAAVPRVMGGRCTVWPCPILDCFALASLALAMTEERTAPRLMDGRCHVLPGPILDCFALACARARNDGAADGAPAAPAGPGRNRRRPLYPTSFA